MNLGAPQDRLFWWY